MTYFPAANIRTIDEFEDNEIKFYLYLIQNLGLKYKTIKYIVQTINRYHAFLERESKRKDKNSYNLYHQFSLKLHFPKLIYDTKNINNKKKKRIYVSQDTFQKLLEVADKRIYSHLKLAYYLGLRRGETYALKEDNVYSDFVKYLNNVNPFKKVNANVRKN